MIRRVGSGLLPVLQNRSRHKRTILQGKGKRGGEGAKFTCSLVIINQHHNSAGATFSIRNFGQPGWLGMHAVEILHLSVVYN